MTDASGPNGVAADMLRAFIERIERLHEEKKAIETDIADVYAEVKAAGFDKKAVQKIIALRRQDDGQRREEQAILELYMAALGMLPGSSGPERDSQEGVPA